MQQQVYDELVELLNVFTERSRYYGYTNIDDVLKDLVEFEKQDPRRICKCCGYHINERFPKCCCYCNKWYHSECYYRHNCVSDDE